MRKITIFLALCIVLLLVGFVGYRGLQVWKQSHGIAMAKSYVTQNDARNAALALEQVIRANPQSLEATRMMADLTQMERTPDSLTWRQRVVELDPKSSKDRLALAQSALMFHNYLLATNALAGISEADKKNVGYQNIAGTTALMGGQLDDAEAYFNEAIRLDPSNPIPALNLAVVRLHRTNSLDMAEARISLQRVIMNSTNVDLANQARRELIVDAVHFNNESTALTLSKELVNRTDASLSDKLLRLNILSKFKSAELRPELAKYKSQAETNLTEIGDMTKWLTFNFSATDALNWLQHLPTETRTNPAVEFQAVTCQLELGDWRGAQTSLQHEDWNTPLRPWNSIDYLRHAYLARSLEQQGFREAATAEWNVAVKSISSSIYPSIQKSEYQMLFNLAAVWQWNSEGEQILWTIVNSAPDEKWADATLAEALAKWHRTRSFMELLKIDYRRDPENPQVENNLAMTALLLKAQEVNPYNLAQKAYEKRPTDPSFISTYAFSLYLQGKNADALKIMQQASQKELQNPAIAGYYGLILKANGKNAEAKAYLNLVSQPDLMPEEKVLFDQAKAGL